MTENSSLQINVYRQDATGPEVALLKSGEGVFVGSAETCGIKLDGTDVASFHCRIEFLDREILVQDCGTGGATWVNEQKVTSDHACQLGDTIVVGDSRLVLLWPTIEQESDVPVDQFETSPEHLPDLSSEPELGTELEPVFEEPVVESEASRFQLPEVEPQNELNDPKEIESEFEYDYEPEAAVADQFDFELEEELEDWGSDDRTANSGLMNAEMDLLKSEIEYLQNELSIKDQQIVELMTQDSAPLDVDSGETEKLVVRLEELLEELQQSDNRVKSLEDVLRYTEEANRAEQEERAQIERWLGEVESRVEQSEAEKEAEIASLQNRLRETETRRAKAESQLKKVLSKSESESHSNSDSVSQVNSLTQKVAQLERLLESTAEEKQLAEQKVQELQSYQGSAARAQELEQKLVQIELETSRERAAIARERAELEMKLEQAVAEQRPGTKLDDSDYRFAAMRDHLREIHEEEKLEQLQKKQNSLSSRISRLLKGK